MEDLTEQEAGCSMANLVDIHKALLEENRRKQEEATSQEQFVAKWMFLSEKEKARLIFQALSNKAERDHSHPHEEY